MKIKILSFARITQRKKTLRNINCIRYVTGCVQLNRVHCSSTCIHAILYYTNAIQYIQTYAIDIIH